MYVVPSTNSDLASGSTDFRVYESWKGSNMAGGRGRQRGGGSNRRRSTSSVDDEEMEAIDQQSPVVVEESTNDDESSDQTSETIQFTPEGKMILDPAGFWFSSQKVVRGCTQSTKQKMTGVAPTCWTKATSAQKEEWFNNFRKTFDWPAGIEYIVRQRYNETCTRRLRDNMYKVVKRKKEPEHMRGGAYEDMLKYRETAEFQARSAQASKNKKGGKKDGAAEPSHHAGSRSFLDLVLGKGKKKKANTPTAPELFLDTHSRLENNRRYWIKPRDKDLYEAFSAEKLRQPDKSDNEIWFDLVKGFKKGNVYGIGSAKEAFYETPRGRMSSTSKQTYEPTVVGRLQAALDEERRKNAERDEELRIMKEKFKAWESRFDNCNQGPPPFRRDYDEGNGGGGLFSESNINLDF